VRRLVGRPPPPGDGCAVPPPAGSSGPSLSVPPRGDSGGRQVGGGRLASWLQEERGASREQQPWDLQQPRDQLLCSILPRGRGQRRAVRGGMGGRAMSPGLAAGGLRWGREAASRRGGGPACQAEPADADRD